MPKRNRNRRRTMKGGLFEGWFGSSDTSSTSSYQPEGSSWYSGITGKLSSWTDKAKQGASSMYNSAKTSISGTPSYGTTTSYNAASDNNQYQQTTYGGKTRKRRMRGGFSNSRQMTGLAANSASFSGPTAKPHTWVGGRTRKQICRKKHKHMKSCKHRK